MSNEVEQSGPARIAWLALLVMSGLGALNHGMGVFGIAEGDTEQLMFALFAGVNLYALAVLLGPYRRGEQWAWLVTWVEVAAFAVVFPLVDEPGIGTAYLVGAGVAALAQVVAWPAFGKISATART